MRNRTSKTPARIACRQSILLPAVFAFAISGSHIQAQTADSTAKPPRPEPSSESDAESNERLYEQGILQTDAQPDSRKIFAHLLLNSTSEDATERILNLLQMQQRPEVQLSMVRALHDASRAGPQQLMEAYVEPLITLLAKPEPSFREPASAVLSAYPSDTVIARLGDVAADPQNPVHQRIAAVGALAPNNHRRVVIEALLKVLEVSDSEVAASVVDALKPAATEPVGDDFNAWKRWWQVQSRVSDETRLAAQSRFYRQQYQQLLGDFSEYRNATQGRTDTLESRLAGFQREVAFAMKPEARHERLIIWLRDSEPLIVRNAVGIINSQMADEGVRPDEKMLEALLGLLRGNDNEIRRRVLAIVQFVTNPKVITEILQQLKDETDPVMRLAFLKAIGELNLPLAIPAIVEEIESPEARPEWVREAATALGNLATRAALPNNEEIKNALAARATSIERALKDRYDSAGPDQRELRAALLQAMAGVLLAMEGNGRDAFITEFINAIESDEALIVRPAIRGLRALNDASQMPRIRDLTAHPDLLVRQEAIRAVSAMARQKPDLECLLTRIQPTNEEDRQAREYAWEGVKNYLADRSLEQQLITSERLRELPEREFELLTTLAKSLNPKNESPAQIETVLMRLAGVCVERRDFEAAAEYLNRLWHVQQSAGISTVNTAITWFEASMLGFPVTNPTEPLRLLASSNASVENWDNVLDMLRTRASSSDNDTDSDRMRQLVKLLREIDIENLPPQWQGLLRQWSESIAASREKTPISGSTNGRGKDG